MKLSKTTVLLAGIAAFTILAVWTIAAGRQSSIPPNQAATPSPAASPPSGNQTQTNEGGSVTVAVTPQELASGKPAVFQLVFDTHSVNLDFDVAAAAELIDDQGTAFGTPTWSGDPPGGHHRKGTLTFPTAIEQAERVTLTVRNIAGVKERTFEWKFSESTER